MVWPKFRIARTPFSVSSCPTTSALIAQQRAIVCSSAPGLPANNAGNVRYDVYQQADPRTNHFTVFAVWDSERALDAYGNTPHWQQFREALGQPRGDREELGGICQDERGMLEDKGSYFLERLLTLDDVRLVERDD